MRAWLFTNVWLFILPLALGTMTSLAQGQEAKPDTEQHKRMEYLIGTWDVAVKFRLPDGKDGEGTATCQTKWILDDKVVHQEYKSKFMGQPLTVVQLLSYDTVKKRFVEFQLHVDPTGVHTTHNEGAFSDDGKILTLVGDSIDGFTGKPVKVRGVTTIVDENRYTVEWFITEPGGKEERRVVLTHTRKK